MCHLVDNLREQCDPLEIILHYAEAKKCAHVKDNSRFLNALWRQYAKEANHLSTLNKVASIRYPAKSRDDLFWLDITYAHGIDGYSYPYNPEAIRKLYAEALVDPLIHDFCCETHRKAEQNSPVSSGALFRLRYYVIKDRHYINDVQLPTKFKRPFTFTPVSYALSIAKQTIITLLETMESIKHLPEIPEEEVLFVGPESLESRIRRRLYREKEYRMQRQKKEDAIKEAERHRYELIRRRLEHYFPTYKADPRLPMSHDRESRPRSVSMSHLDRLEAKTKQSLSLNENVDYLRHPMEPLDVMQSWKMFHTKDRFISTQERLEYASWRKFSEKLDEPKMYLPHLIDEPTNKANIPWYHHRDISFLFGPKATFEEYVKPYAPSSDIQKAAFIKSLSETTLIDAPLSRGNSVPSFPKQSMKEPEVSTKSAFKKKHNTEARKVHFHKVVYFENRETLMKLFFHPTQAANSNIKLMARQLKEFLDQYPDCPQPLSKPVKPSCYYLKKGTIRVNKKHIPNESSFFLAQLPDLEDPEDWSDKELLEFEKYDDEDEDYSNIVYQPLLPSEKTLEPSEARLDPPVQLDWFSAFLHNIAFGIIAYILFMLVIKEYIKRGIIATTRLAGNVVCNFARTINPFNWVPSLRLF